MSNRPSVLDGKADPATEDIGAWARLIAEDDYWPPHSYREDVVILPRSFVVALVDAYLALKEAALDVIVEAQQAVGVEDPFGSQGPPILVGANAWFALQEAVAPGKTQAEIRAAVSVGSPETRETEE